MRALISFLLLISVATSGAAYLEGERGSVIAAYWREKLPTTPIPQSVQELISANDGVPLIRLVEESESTPKTEKTHLPDELHSYQGAYVTDEAYVKLFLLEKNLLCGNKMSLNFSTAQQKMHFLPRTVAEKIPFSSDELSVSLKELNIAPDSVAAMDMKKTLQACERPAVKGETKFCATSLESMVDFMTTSKLGSNRLTALATNVPKMSKYVNQEYTIVGMKYEDEAEKAAYVCHIAKYAYAVYYCHTLEGTKVARVWLRGEDRSTVEATGICHTDTSAWDPKHPALQRLNVKPGGASVCHFVPQNHLVWVRTT